jgi:hypothetical protein
MASLFLVGSGFAEPTAIPSYDLLEQTSRALASAPLPAAGAPVRLYFNIEAQVRSFAVDADVIAGGVLLMKPRPATEEDPEGAAWTYGLEAPEEHPWIFYWVDLAGPSEKAGGGVSWTLADATRDTVRRANEGAIAFLREIHRRWKLRGGRKGLDEYEVFYIFGSPRDRFRYSLRTDGSLVGDVSNEMTRTWVPNFLEKVRKDPEAQGYGKEGAAGKRPDWEPRAYKALQVALRLFGTGAFPPEGPEAVATRAVGSELQAPVGDMPKVSADALHALVPEFDEEVEIRGEPTIGLKLTAVDADRVVLEGGSPGTKPVEVAPGVQGRIERRTLYSRRERRVLEDHILVHSQADKDTFTRVRIGYLPASATSP